MKKFLKFIFTIIIILLIIVGFFAYYAGHSEIDDKYEKGTTNVNTILKSIAKSDDKGSVIVDYDDFNNILNSKVDFKEIDAVSAATILNGYYSKANEKFAVTMHTSLGNTTLLLDPKVELDGDKAKITLDNPKLGKWKIPIPRDMAKMPIKESVDIPKFPWIIINDLDFDKKGLKITYAFDTENINKELRNINAAIDPAIFQYIDAEKVDLPAQEIIFKSLVDAGYEYTDEDLKTILNEFVENQDNIVNWVLLVPEDKQDDFINLSKIIIGEEKTNKALEKIRR